MSSGARTRVKGLLQAISPAERMEGSRLICQRLMDSFGRIHPDSVTLYSSMPLEVDLSHLAQWCETVGIPTAFPRMDDTHASGMRMLQARLTHTPDWEPGAFGFLQPLATLPEWRARSAKDVILVPGLLFGEQGERTGRGKGHYDRYLAHCMAFRIGVAFDIQVQPGLGQNPWDQAMHALVTPTRWIGTIR